MKAVLLSLALFALCALCLSLSSAQGIEEENLSGQLAAEDSSSSHNLRAKNKGKRDNKPHNKNIKNNHKGGKKKGEKGQKRDSPEHTALRAWAEGLQPADYEEEHWRTSLHSRSAADFFHAYAQRLSTLWKTHRAKVNFALIGACDGLGDKTIKQLYLPQSHWRGVFVEPMSINVRDLISFMADKGAAKRSVIIRAAATSRCLNETIRVERPLYEEKNASLPHWLRRQIGSVLPSNRNHARREWTIEEVRCVTARDVLREWGELTSAKPVNGVVFRRPHILKVDVEGHDFDVLMGFLSEDVSVHELPLMIDFEAKSIAKKYPIAKQRMEELGYAVTSFGQDGFALLKKEKILESLNQISTSFIPNDVEPV